MRATPIHEQPPATPVNNNMGRFMVDVVMVAGALAEPAVNVLGLVAPVPGLNMALSLVEKIFAVMEQMRYNKKQCRRLAESARDVVEAVEEALAGITPEEVDASLITNVDKLVRSVHLSRVFIGKTHSYFIPQDAETH